METLKDFRNILFGQQLEIFTDHENLVQKSLRSDRVMRWRLYIEEYSPNLIYLKGIDNQAADAVSRLPLSSPNETVIAQLQKETRGNPATALSKSQTNER